jgi:predicted DsbA family dithiol-disulfide isomerase
MAGAVTLDAWIDFLCPWSYVVSTRIDRLSAEFGDRIDIEWRAFMTVTEPVERPLDEFRTSTSEWMEPASQEPSLGFSLWSTDNRPPTHSAPALAAHKVVTTADPSRADAFRRAVFAAYFGENRTISDSPVLIAAARSVGVDDDVFAMTLRGHYGEYVQQVIDDHQAALRTGIETTPAVVVGGEYLVKGAASYVKLRTLVERLL